jgi:hypothetical protein
LESAAGALCLIVSSPFQSRTPRPGIRLMFYGITFDG